MDGVKEDRGLVWLKRCSQILFEHLLKLDSIVAWLTATDTTNLFLGAKVQTETFSASNQRAVQEAGFQEAKTTPKNQHY